jgi:hypothetical protein
MLPLLPIALGIVLIGVGLLQAQDKPAPEPPKPPKKKKAKKPPVTVDPDEPPRVSGPPTEPPEKPAVTGSGTVLADDDKSDHNPDPDPT